MIKNNITQQVLLLLIMASFLIIACERNNDFPELIGASDESLSLNKANANDSCMFLYAKEGGIIYFNRQKMSNLIAYKIDALDRQAWSLTNTELPYPVSIIDDVAQTKEGDLIMVSLTKNEDELFLLKIDQNGNFKWQKTIDFGTEQIVLLANICQTSDKGFAIAGSSSEHKYIIKTNADGETEWIKTLKNEGSYPVADIIQTGDNGYLISFGQWIDCNYILKLNSEGNFEQKVELPSNIQYIQDIEISGDGKGYLVSAFQVSNDVYGSRKLGLLKIDNSFNVLWQQEYSYLLFNQHYAKGIPERPEPLDVKIYNSSNNDYHITIREYHIEKDYFSHSIFRINEYGEEIEQ